MTTRDEKLEVYLEGARKFFPGIKSSSSFSMFNPDLQSEPSSGKIELSSRFLNESALEKGNIQFIHYTSLSSAMNILNSGKIRLYNCLNLNDPSEIKCLLDKSPIDFKEDIIEKYKREHFILSGSLFESDKDEDFNLWRLYGDNSTGIGIVFEVDDRVKNWSSVFLQKVAYSSNDNDLAYDYLKFHKEFNDQYHLFENNPDLFAILATGVKNDIWSIEKEFRIVIKAPFDRYSFKPKEGLRTNSLISSTLQHEYKPDGRLVSYVDLPLHLKDRKSQKTNLPLSGEEVDLIDYVPNLRIKKLILGPNSNFKLRSEFLDYEMWIKDKMKYDFEVNLSSIKI